MDAASLGFAMNSEMSEYPVPRQRLQSLFAAMLLLLCPCLVAQDESAEKPPADQQQEAQSSEDVKSKDSEQSKGDGSTDPKDEEKKEEEEEDEEPIPFRDQPYLVRVEIGFGLDCLRASDDREELLRRTRGAISRMYGRAWEATVAETSSMVPSGRRHLEWLEEERLVEAWPESTTQKMFFVSLERAGLDYIISCREYDARVQELGPLYFRRTGDIRGAGTMIAELLRDSFRPCVLYERKFLNAEERQIMELQVQAGAIPIPDPSAEQVVENDVLRPFVREMNRRDPTQLNRLLKLELAYIRVLHVDRGVKSGNSSRKRVEGDVDVPEEEQTKDSAIGYSPGRVHGFYITHSPIERFGSRGRRNQYFALRQRPAAEDSMVRITLKGKKDRPLVAHRLKIAYQLHWKDEEDGPQTGLVTDRNGEVVIPQRENHPTFWIRVYSGTSLLARVPYSPGLVPSDTIELPDDSIRLFVEGELQLLTDQLIDSIALRGVLVARAKKAAERGDTKLVTTLLDEYARVPAKKQFTTWIEDVQAKADIRLRDKGLRSRMVSRMTENMQGSVDRFFSPEREAERDREISQLRSTAGQNAAGN